MNTIVIYASSYGSTKQYAEWIAEKLHAEISDCSKISIEKLMQFDTIIFGGGLYAGTINGAKKIARYADSLCGKKLVLFTVGIADVEKKENIDHIQSCAAKIFPPQMLEKMSIYHFRGSMFVKNLSFIHKIMMNMLKIVVSKKPESEKTQDDREMLECFDKPVDFTSRASIEPLIEEIQSIHA